METLKTTGSELMYQSGHRRVRGQTAILARYIIGILPVVKRFLAVWEEEAEKCQNSELRRQALLSLKNKDFHCQGGAVFALPFPDWRQELITLIVAYQTICDYLDNLCDRAGCTDGRAFRQLHLALPDALTPGQDHADYYKYYLYKNDGGYLNKLVDECRRCLNRLPSWRMVQKDSLRLAELYSNLQVYKHLVLEAREDTLKEWAATENQGFPYLYWQEFAAACGSTLAIFALMGLAALEDLEAERVKDTLEAYFPWICSLHILLDYFIDRQEDMEGGDLNFTSYYPTQSEMIERLKLLVRQSHHCAGSLSDHAFAKTVVEGLLAMYLSDSKIKEQALEKTARELLAESGPDAFRTYRLCKAVRKFI
jgi:tetraprenyl-beta-curcumene synthase